MMKKTLLSLSAAAAFAVSANAQTIISMDLGNSTSLGTSDTAGFVPVDNWNNPTGFPTFTDQALNYDDGTASGATATASTFSVNSTSTVGVVGTDDNTTMFNRMLGIGNAAGTVTVNGLDSGVFGSGYDVYLYFAPSSGASEDPAPIQASIGSTTYYASIGTSGSNYSGSFVRADSTSSGSPSTTGNYFLFEDVTGTSFTASLVQTGGGASDTGLSGVQIVAVPEPSTFALVGLAFGAVVLFRRRKS